MNSPVLALAWQSWRLSRRWYLLVLGVGLLGITGLLKTEMSGMPPEVDLRAMTAYSATSLAIVLSLLATFIAVSIGNKKGFPFHFEFRLPVSTPVLVIIPMLCFSLLCASLFFLPMLLFRLIYGLHFPVLAGSMLVMIVAWLLISGAWIATGDSVRVVSVGASLIAVILMLAWMNPFSALTDIQGPPTKESLNLIVNFALTEYVLLLLIMVLLGVAVVHFVSLQRNPGHSHAKRSTAGSAELSEKTASTENRNTRLTRLNSVLSLDNLPCPDGPPWKAELWLELRRFGGPALMVSLAIMLAVPVVIVIRNVSGWHNLDTVIDLMPMSLFFMLIGITLFNRRQKDAGMMKPFERSRPLATRQLALLQLGTSSMLNIVALIPLVAVLWVSSTLLAGEGASTRYSEWLTGYFSLEPLLMLSDLWLFFAAVPVFAALFFVLHTCSLIWGRKFFIGVMVLMFLCVNLTFRIATKQASPESIGTGMMVFSALAGALTLLALWHLSKHRLASMRFSLIGIAVWLSVVICGLYSLNQHGFLNAATDSALLGFFAAALLMPLTIAMLSLWGYDRLRHQ